jgi:hypothetical protein
LALSNVMYTNWKSFVFDSFASSRRGMQFAFVFVVAFSLRARGLYSAGMTGTSGHLHKL